MYTVKDYDDSLELILNKGVRKQTRTGIDTLSIFGMQCRYDISEYFPILTKRKLFPKSIFAELLWMISGSTNVNDLEKLGSKIWTPWKNKEFEDKNGYQDGELGPIYGFQLRNFGGDYGQNNGFDQISYVVNELKNNPESRRILFSYWNPPDVTSSRARLPPCHFSFILNVTEGKLNGMMVQRSADVPIGVPANVIFYSVLIYMLAQQVNLVPGEFIHSIADAHIYVDQIPAVEEYLGRPEVNSPKLKLNKASSIFHYKLDDFIVEDYNPLEKITIPVAV